MGCVIGDVGIAVVVGGADGDGMVCGVDVYVGAGDDCMGGVDGVIGGGVGIGDIGVGCVDIGEE